MIFFLGKKLIWQFEFILSKFWCRKLQISGMDSIYNGTNEQKETANLGNTATPPQKKKNKKKKKKLKSQTKTS